MLALMFLAGAGIPADPIIDSSRPLLSDFDISGTAISVEVTPGPGYYEYVYTFAAPETNIGKAQNFWLDTSCREQLSDNQVTALFPANTGADFRSMFNDVPYMPVLGMFPNGNSKLMDVSVAGTVSFWVQAEPGQVKTVRFRSTGAPTSRSYSLSANVSYYERIEWPESGHIPGLPSEFDFEVSGVITGPGCTTTASASSSPVVFPGEDIRAEFPETQALLTYSSPLRNRLHVEEGKDHVELGVHYGAALDPASFEACPREVTRLFNPQPGGQESVRIPLEHARNFLTLAARAVGEPPLQPEHDRVSHSPIDVDLFEFRRTDVPYQPREIACRLYEEIPEALVRRPPPPPPEYDGEPLLRLLQMPATITVFPGQRHAAAVILSELADPATLRASLGGRDISDGVQRTSEAGGFVNIPLPTDELGTQRLVVTVEARADVVGAPEVPFRVEQDVTLRGMQVQVQGRQVRIDADGNRSESTTRSITIEMDPRTGRPVGEPEPDENDNDN